MGATPTPSSLFGVRPDDSSSDGFSNVRKLAGRVVAAGALPGGGAVVAAVLVPPTAESPEVPTRSRLVLLRGSEDPLEVYLRSIKGRVTGLSVSPDGSQAILAVRQDARDAEAQKAERFEVQVYQFSESRATRVARMPRGKEILGAPQWTPRGIHFVAGEANDPAEAARDGDPASYALYRVPAGSDAPELVRGVGEDFVAASISTSPDARRLAVVGRRNPGSPTHLYVLDLTSETLKAATANESMEVKTNPRDLAWSPDGRSVVLVARGPLSGHEVYDAPANTLMSAFYKLYEVPVDDPTGGGPEG